MARELQIGDAATFDGVEHVLVQVDGKWEWRQTPLFMIPSDDHCAYVVINANKPQKILMTGDVGNECLASAAWYLRGGDAMRYRIATEAEALARVKPKWPRWFRYRADPTCYRRWDSETTNVVVDDGFTLHCRINRVEYDSKDQRMIEITAADAAKIDAEIAARKAPSLAPCMEAPGGLVPLEVLMRDGFRFTECHWLKMGGEWQDAPLPHAAASAHYLTSHPDWTPVPTLEEMTAEGWCISQIRIPYVRWTAERRDDFGRRTFSVLCDTFPLALAACRADFMKHHEWKAGKWVRK